MSKKKVDKGPKSLTFDEMVDQGVEVMLRALGKGSDLRSSISLIINSSACWGAENARRYDREHK